MAIGKFLKFVAYVACKLCLAPSESCLTMFAKYVAFPCEIQNANGGYGGKN